MKKIFSLLFLMIVFVCTFAQTNTFNVTSGTWNSAGNWTLGIPTALHDVVIPTGRTVTGMSAGTVNVCKTLTVDPGGVLIFSGGNPRQIIVSGDVTINGTVNMTGSNQYYIVFSGTSFTAGSTATLAMTTTGLEGGVRCSATSGNVTITNNSASTFGSINVTGANTTKLAGTNLSMANILVGNASGIFNIPLGQTLTTTTKATTVTAGKIIVDGTLINSSATAMSLTGAGALTVNGTYQHNNNTGTLTGSAAIWNTNSICEIKGITTATAITATGQSFYNLIWNCAGQTTGCNFSGSLTTVTGNFDIQNSNNQNVRLTGNTALTLNITGDFKVSGLNGISKLDVCNGTGAPTVNVGGNVVIGGNGFASTVLSANASTIKVKGNWTNGANGVFTPANTTVEFNSTTADQTITRSAGETFNVLNINNTFGSVILANNVTASTLTLTAGKVQTGANSISVSTAGGLTTGSATSYVNGTLIRAVALNTVPAVAFPIGDASNYTPVSLIFASNAAGNVTASTAVPGLPPAVASGINQSNYINRNWTLAFSAAANYSATFNYINPGDVTGAPSLTALRVGQNNGGTWTNPTGSSVAGAATTSTGITTGGTFSLGDVVYTITSSAGANGTISPNGTTSVNAGANQTYTITADPCYTIADVLVDGVSVGAVGTYTFTAVGVNHTIAASFIINNTFSGTGNWTDNARWSCGAPPASSDNVTIAAGANATLNTNFTVAGTLIMTATSTLTVNPTQTLTISGTTDFAGQSVTFKSDATGTASLGQVSGTLNGATNVTVERYIPNNGFRSWRLLSVPTSGSQTIKQSWQENQAPGVNGLPNYGTQITGPVFANGLDAASASASLKKYNGTAWVGVTSTLGAISAEKAYFMYVRGERSKGVTGLTTDASATTLRTTGTISTGTQTTASIPANSFAVVGNLYPSAINFTGLTLNGSVAAVPYFYIWDSKKLSGSSLGAYQLFTSADGYTCNLAGGSYVAGSTGNTIIESGQAFFVQTGGTPGSVTFNESAKTTSSGNLGFRPSTPGSIAKFVSRVYAGTNMADVNVVIFDNKYSAELGAEDAPKLQNPGENFAIMKSGKTLAFEGRPLIAGTDMITFTMGNLRQQSYKFEFVPANLDNQDLTAVLEDAYLHTSTTVSLAATTTVNFTVDANAASAAANRFRIVFKQAPVRFSSIAAIRNSIGVKVDWEIAVERAIRNYEVERSADGINFVNVATVTAKGNSANAISYTVADASAPSAEVYYRIKAVSLSGEIIYSSKIKVSVGNTKVGFAVSPNPVEGKVVNLQFKNQPAGKYQVRLLNTGGQLVTSLSVSHTGGNSIQLMSLPSAVNPGTYQLEIIAADKTVSTQKLIVN